MVACYLETHMSCADDQDLLLILLQCAGPDWSRWIIIFNFIISCMSSWEIYNPGESFSVHSHENELWSWVWDYESHLQCTSICSCGDNKWISIFPLECIFWPTSYWILPNIGFYQKINYCKFPDYQLFFISSMGTENSIRWEY